MTYTKYRRTMHEETAKRNRNCLLCNEPITKGQHCYTVVVSGRTWPSRLHIHKWHCKPITIKNCKNRMKCLTGDYYCNTTLCKNRTNKGW